MGGRNCISQPPGKFQGLIRFCVPRTRNRSKGMVATHLVLSANNEPADRTIQGGQLVRPVRGLDGVDEVRPLEARDEEIDRARPH